MDQLDELKGRSVLCQKTVSSYRKMQDIPPPPPISYVPSHPLFMHSDTNRAMTPLHSTVPPETQPYLPHDVYFFRLVVLLKLYCPPTLDPFFL